MKMMSDFKMVIVLAFVGFLSACNPTPQQVAEIATLIPIIPSQFVPSGIDERPIGTIRVEINACGGGIVTLGETIEFRRAVSVTTGMEAEITAAIGPANFEALKARIAAYFARTINEEVVWSAERLLTPASNSSVNYLVRVSELWEQGHVIADMPGLGVQQLEYSVLTGFTYDIIDSQNVGCGTASPMPAISVVPVVTQSILLTPTNVVTIVAATATLSAESMAGVAPLEDFSSRTWYNNPARFRNFGGVCTYDGDGLVGILISTSSGFCVMAVVASSSSEQVPLNSVRTYSADITLGVADGYMGQGIGFNGPGGWWLICTLRQDANNALVAVFELQSPSGTFNRYVPVSSRSASISITIENDTIVCSQNGNVIGSVPVAQLFFAPDALITLVVNSDRPVGAVMNTLDNIVVRR